jgi:hypothetical protein
MIIRLMDDNLTMQIKVTNSPSNKVPELVEPVTVNCVSEI